LFRFLCCPQRSVAKNNIEIFMDYQREDGRLPGVIYNREGTVTPNYAQFQGLYFAMPAFELYFLLEKDTTYLLRVYKSLESFDEYLWKTRDSDGNGCLETWCMYDNGEDHSVRFNGFPNAWSFDFPPTKEAAANLTPEELRIHCKQDSYDSTKEMTVPIESMDVMSYSYSCRDVLSLISKELNNGKEKYWREKADTVKAGLNHICGIAKKMLVMTGIRTMKPCLSCFTIIYGVCILEVLTRKWQTISLNIT